MKNLTRIAAASIAIASLGMTVQGAAIAVTPTPEAVASQSSEQAPTFYPSVFQYTNTTDMALDVYVEHPDGSTSVHTLVQPGQTSDLQFSGGRDSRPNSKIVAYVHDAPTATKYFELSGTTSENDDLTLTMRLPQTGETNTVTAHKDQEAKLRVGDRGLSVLPTTHQSNYFLKLAISGDMTEDFAHRTKFNVVNKSKYNFHAFGHTVQQGTQRTSEWNSPRAMTQLGVMKAMRFDGTDGPNLAFNLSLRPHSDGPLNLTDLRNGSSFAKADVAHQYGREIIIQKADGLVYKVKREVGNASTVEFTVTITNA